ncbi:MAG: SRPBCC family protein [Nitrospirae bacterium]|nr:SRPBCC family protein [Nitrospirota bacterium]
MSAGAPPPGGEVSFQEVKGADGKEGIEARIRIEAPPSAVWNVLTDYNRLSEFIPDLLVSRVVGEDGGDPILYQQGKVRVLFYIFRGSVTLRVHEEFSRLLTFSQTTGDFEYFRGDWRFVPLDDGKVTELIYTLWAQPRFYAPQWLVEMMLKRDIPKRLFALKERVLRESPPVGGGRIP